MEGVRERGRERRKERTGREKGGRLLRWKLGGGGGRKIQFDLDSLPVIHANVVLAQAVTLNVAINSHNKALLTIMVSNNFVELKGSVFKKFETNNLFQMSCSGE